MTDVERAATSSRRRILVVDDSALVRLYYRDTLERAGFEVEQAINGIEAMEKVLAQPFDLVIVDVNMPRMDGFSFLRTLRRGAADVATLPERPARISTWSSRYRNKIWCATPQLFREHRCERAA